ncbi:MAG TPA: CHAT domain-containing protein, partial [Longimicrobium sp.]|nr:CHAT domain-containing protein [Longimicrobium sp.]
MDLLWADSSGKRVRAAISSLERASRLSPNSAAVLADLSGAYLVQAERTQDPRDLLEALTAADAAVGSDARSRPARFNLALSLEWLRLDNQAVAAWREYLALDARSEWAGEARERMAAITRAHAPPRPASTAGADEVMRFAERSAPQVAQLLGWDELLAQWGEAVDRGAVQQAHDRLKLAATLGDLLVRRGGDASLSDQVWVIRGHSRNQAETRRLAQAHQAYARARHAFRDADYETADTLFDRVLPLAGRGTPLYQWASVFHSSTQAYRNLARGEVLAREALSRIDSIRYPALAGRAHWILGTILLRSARPASAVDEYDEAARFFERAGEPEHLGIVQVFSGVAKYQLGDPLAAYTRLHRGLGHLRAYRASPWLHTALYQQAEIVVGEGRVRAGAHILDEDAAAAGRTAIALYLAESLTLRARLLGSTGRGGWTRRDLMAAQRAVGRMPQGKAKRWFTNELREARAAVTGSTPSAHSVALLDSAVREWRELAVPVRMIAPLLARADAQLALGSTSASERDLLRALELLDQQRGDIGQPVDRAIFLDARAGVFNRLAMLRIRAGRPNEALGFLERGRISYTSARDTARAGRLPPPAGQTVLDYALIGDTLLIWTIRGKTASFTRRTVQRDALVHRIEQLRALLELGGDEDAARPSLEGLYGELVEPVEDRLGEAGMPLVVVADGEIAGVPFAALWNPRTRHYLVQTRVIRFSSTLADAQGGRYARTQVPSSVLIVADPAFDRDAYPDLTRLAGALGEGRALASRYPRASLLEGEAATHEALLGALPTAEMVHYGGHALFDDERPARSRLVLAPARDRAGR